MRRKNLLKKLKLTLLRRRAQLRGVLDEYATPHEPREFFVGDAMDHAVDREQEENSFHLAEVECNELAAIDLALGRVREGTYGNCEECEKPIPMARLLALPHASLCIRCQRQNELPDVGDENNHENGFELEAV